MLSPDFTSSSVIESASTLVTVKLAGPGVALSTAGSQPSLVIFSWIVRVEPLALPPVVLLDEPHAATATARHPTRRIFFNTERLLVALEFRPRQERPRVYAPGGAW
jgi:hypothetical protein